MQAMPGWKRDAARQSHVAQRQREPATCGRVWTRSPAFAVTEITDDGYLRLREVGAGRQHPLWIQFHEGQRIRVLTRSGAVPGVVVVKSTHLQRGRVANAPVTTLDDLWVDVGATSKAEVQRLGIEMLDPVVRDSPAWLYGSHFVSGQLAGVRVGCAAVASAARGQVTNGETIFLLTTLRSFGHDGFEAALRTLGRVDEVTLVDQVADAPASADSVVQRKVEKPSYLPESTGLTSLTILAPRVRFAGTLVESVQVSDAEKLLDAVEKAAGLDSSISSSAWHGPDFPECKSHRSSRQDPLSATADLLKSLADVPSVSGHEREVREAIDAALTCLGAITHAH